MVWNKTFHYYLFISLQIDIDIHQLSLNDAEFINDSWKYKSEDSLEQIKYQIEHFPTIG
jgi:hypothetical protein